MANSDRTIFKYVLAGTLGANRSVANAYLCIAQDAQRYQYIDIGAVTATTAATTYTLPGCRFDRPVQMKEVRVLPGGALTFSITVSENIAWGYTNDNSGTLTATLGTANTNGVPNGGTGNWSYGTSVLLAPNNNINQIIPSGSQLALTITPVSTGTAIPAGTRFQFIYEEV